MRRDCCKRAFCLELSLPPLSEVMHPRAPLSFHVPAQIAGSPLRANDRTLIKFNSFWTIKLEPGYSLYATHPANRDDLPFRTLTGLVDTDRYNTVGILFLAIWTNSAFEGTLPAGTPVAQCFLVARNDLQLEFAPFSEEKTAAYDATAKELLGERGLYRKVYRDRRARDRRPSSSK